MPPKKKQSKADTAQIAQRIEEILRMRLDGAQFHDIVQYGAEKGWGVKERQIRKYIRRADELLVERQDNNRKRLMARHIAQRQTLFARAVKAADYRTALAILTDEAKLRGLYTSESELKELAKLAVEQGQRICELENILAAAQRNSSTNPTEQSPTQPTDGSDSEPPAPA